MSTAVFALTALWHSLAVVYFGLFPEFTLKVFSHERPISVVATELFRFLAGMNLAVVLLAAGGPWLGEARPFVHLVLALANFTQGAIDLRVWRLGLTRGSFASRIALGDTLATVGNLGAAAWMWSLGS